MEGKTHTTIGKVSLTLGLISFLLIILTAFVTYGTYIGIIASNVIIVVGYLGYFFAIPAAIIAIILGFMAWKKGDKYGLIGLILGLIIIILFIISLVMSAFVYVYVSNMIPSHNSFDVEVDGINNSITVVNYELPVSPKYDGLYFVKDNNPNIRYYVQTNMSISTNTSTRNTNFIQKGDIITGFEDNTNYSLEYSYSTGQGGGSFGRSIHMT